MTELEEALAALERPGMRFLAGGTDLMVSLCPPSREASSVTELVDIKGIETASHVREVGSRLRVGALVTAAELVEDPFISRYAPVVADAAAASSAPLIRARATVGGNLATAHPTADVATALLALNAVVGVATGPDDLDEMPVDVLLDPAQHSSTALQEGRAMIISVDVPTSVQSAFVKVGSRRGFSRTRAAVALSIRAGAHRVVLSGVAHRPFVAGAVSAALDGGLDVRSALVEDITASTVDESTDSRTEDARRAIAVELVERARRIATSRTDAGTTRFDA